MKVNIYILLMFGVRCFADPGSVASQKNVKYFSPAQLTPEQRQACAAFKELSGKTRVQESKVVLGVFPLPRVFFTDDAHLRLDYDQMPFVMTRDDVADLIGEPDSIGGEGEFITLFYDNGFFGGASCMMSVRLRNGHVVGGGEGRTY